MTVRHLKLALALAVALPGVAASAQQRSDLADTAAGTYHGAIISDARGSSRSDITMTIRKTGPNTVLVHCECARIPDRSFELTRAMDTVQNASGSEVFLLELARSPRRLSLTIDDASWSGEAEPAPAPAPVR